MLTLRTAFESHITLGIWAGIDAGVGGRMLEPGTVSLWNLYVSTGHESRSSSISSR